MKKYKCRVCGKRFNHLLIHLHRDGEKILTEKPKRCSLDRRNIKTDHLATYEAIYEEIKNLLDWKSGSEIKCFCGGEIITWEWRDEEGYSIEVSCDRCGFIWGALTRS